MERPPSSSASAGSVAAFSRGEAIRMLRPAAFIARKDLQYLLRQRETLLWTFLMPILFFYFIGTMTGGFGGGGASETIGLSAPAEAGFLVDQVVRRLEDQGLEVVRPESAEEFDRFRRQLTVPQGFTDSLQAGRRVKIAFARRGQGLGSRYDEIRVARAVYTVLADVVVASEEGEPLSPEALERLAASSRPLTLEVSQAGRRREIPRGFEQAIPGTMVMFTLLVLLTSGSVLLVIEREEGLLRRLASAPLPRGAVVLGKWGGRLSLGVIQIGYAMLVGALLFKIRWGPDVSMLALVLLAYGALVAALAMLLGSLARSVVQAVAVGLLASMVLAALGGCWWPIEVTPSWMQRLALFLPTGWAMDALHKLVSFGAGPASAVPHVLGMSATALTLGWLAARTFRFQ